MHARVDRSILSPGVFVGPGAILMVGTREDDEQVHYPVDDMAARPGVISRHTAAPISAGVVSGHGHLRAKPDAGKSAARAHARASEALPSASLRASVT